MRHASPVLARKVPPMPVNGCLFVAIAKGAGGVSLVRPRLGALCTFYRPLGLTELAVEYPSPEVIVGWLSARSPGQALRPQAGTLVWGEPLPSACNELTSAT